MKKIMFLISSLTLLLLSCGDSNDSIKAPVELIAEKNISIEDAEPVLIEIKNPSGSYTLQSSNEAVAIARMLDNQKQFYIWGSESGTATITLTSEETKTTATIEVSIKYLISRPITPSSLVRIKAGESCFLEPPFDMYSRLLGYEVEDKEIIKISSASKELIEIVGLKTGKSNITLQELNLIEYGYGVYVLDIFPLTVRGTTNGSVLSISIEEGIIQTLIDGNGDYKVSVENTEILDAKVREYTDKELNDYHHVYPYGAFLMLEGKQKGRTQISVTDKENQKYEFVVAVF